MALISLAKKTGFSEGFRVLGSVLIIFHPQMKDDFENFYSDFTNFTGFIVSGDNFDKAQSVKHCHYFKPFFMFQEIPRASLGLWKPLLNVLFDEKSINCDKIHLFFQEIATGFIWRVFRVMNAKT